MSQAKELAMVTPDNIPIAQGLCRRSVDIVTLSRAEEGLSSVEEVQIDAVEWAPGKQEYAVMVTIATISLMVALDATILVPALPVRIILRELTRRHVSSHMVPDASGIMDVG
jgi:hypothetical protein